jgi:hypothetical protein
MYYYEVMAFSSQTLLTRVYEMHHWTDKTPGQIFWMVLFLILGLNAWIESLSMFFSISLNLTTRELFFTKTFPYLKPVSKMDDLVHYRYMSSTDQNLFIPPNSGDFKKYRKASWVYNPFYRNFLKNWWDCFLRNIEKKSNNFSTKFLEKNISSLKNNETDSEENSYIYMDDQSDIDKQDDSYSTQESKGLKEENKLEEIKTPQNDDSDDCCKSIDSDSKSHSHSSLSSKEMTVKQMEEKALSMMDSFKFLEQLAVDFKENYGNSSSEPLFCIFSLHCPQREKSLKHLYEKILKYREKLRKKIEEQKSPNISI